MINNVVSAKEYMTQIIESQPDDSSYEEILKELALACMIARGLADSQAGRTIRHEEMKRRIEGWQK
jgi:predicted transcriptional regulator